MKAEEKSEIMKHNNIETVRIQEFTDIVHLIRQSHRNVFKTVNTELINLYWNVGQYISQKIEQSDWGQSVVKELANYLVQIEPDIKGFSDKNLWRMKQFYETYRDFPKLSTLLREISWTNNLTILSRTKTIEEKEFYLQLSKQERYSSRELDRQINSGTFERTMLGDAKLSALLRETHPDITGSFKDSYVFEFLGLQESHSEKDLQKGLISHLKSFILELGHDFLLVGEEYKLQVGNTDFYVDLLLFHRRLQCLVAFELKADKFRPEHLGQLNFYLEALDRDVKMPNENPSIGVLLCKDKDDTVVEYALSRTLSSALVSEFTTKLPDKELLQRKIKIIFEQNEI